MKSVFFGGVYTFLQRSLQLFGHRWLLVGWATVGEDTIRNRCPKLGLHHLPMLGQRSVQLLGQHLFQSLGHRWLLVGRATVAKGDIRNRWPTLGLHLGYATRPSRLINSTRSTIRIFIRVFYLFSSMVNMVD